MVHIQELMKTIPLDKAVGTILCHDITRIVPGGPKGPVFKKGHIVREQDISVLRDVGKENLYVYEPVDGILHENEAASRIAKAIAGDNLRLSTPSEGRINFYADCQGLLHVDASMLTSVNMLGEISVATLHSLQEVKKNQPVAGTRIIPLLIEEEKIVRLEKLVQKPLLNILPFKPFRVGIVTTGSEIYHGRIEDAFGPVLRAKCARWGCEVIGQRLTGDDTALTSAAVLDFISAGAQMILVTGGMSVDPDDCTPLAIRQAGAQEVTYGAPAFPGAMFMLSYIGETPVLGLPGCVMYYKASIFDVLASRLLAGLHVSGEDIARLGHGGFCAACPECRYPLCSFGKV